LARNSSRRPANHLSSPPASILVRTRQGIGMAENVVAMDLVGEQVEAEVRFRLRLEIELPLKRPDPFRCLQAHRQSPILCFFVKRTRSQGPCLHRRYPTSTGRWPCPTPARAVAQGDVEVAPLAQDRSPPLPGSPFRRAMPTTPADRSGCSCRLLPRSTRPSPKLRRAGIRDFTVEACSGFTPVTARRIAQPKAALVTRLRPGHQSPGPTARQLPDLTDNSLGGSSLHW
jgi:hypothetical protein